MQADTQKTFEHYASTDTVRGDLKNKSVRSSIYVASSGGVELVLRIVTVSILARLLSPEQFGLIAMVTAVTSVVDGFRDLGLSTATVQRQHITHQQISNLFWINVTAGSAFAVLFIALSPLIAAFYHEPRLREMTFALTTVFVLAGLSIQHSALMTRQLKQGELALITVGASVLSVVVAVSMAMTGWGYWALVWREISRALFWMIGVWLGCRWIPTWPRRCGGTTEMLRFGRDIGFTSLLTALISNVDRLLIGRLGGAVAVGVYRQAQSLLMVPIDQLNAPIISVSQPALSALQDDPERYRRYYEKIVLLVSLITVPCGVFAAVYAEEVTLLVLGSGWSGAAVFVRIFAVAAAIRPTIGTSAVVLITSGKSNRFLMLAVVHSVVLIGLMLASLKWGAQGVALAQVATTVVLLIPKLYYSFLDTPVTIGSFWSAARLPVIAGCVMAVGLTATKTVLFTGAHMVPALLVGAVIGTALYFGVWLIQAPGRLQLLALSQDVIGSLPKTA